MRKNTGGGTDVLSLTLKLVSLYEFFSIDDGFLWRFSDGDIDSVGIESSPFSISSSVKILTF